MCLHACENVPVCSSIYTAHFAKANCSTSIHNMRRSCPVTHHQASEQLCLNTQPGLVLILETSEGILGKERGRASICRTDCDLNRQLRGVVCECVCVCCSPLSLRIEFSGSVLQCVFTELTSCQGCALISPFSMCLNPPSFLLLPLPMSSHVAL